MTANEGVAVFLIGLWIGVIAMVLVAKAAGC